jgi:hypothetical protein
MAALNQQHVIEQLNKLRTQGVIDVDQNKIGEDAHFSIADLFGGRVDLSTFKGEELKKTIKEIVGVLNEFASSAPLPSELPQVKDARKSAQIVLNELASVWSGFSTSSNAVYDTSTNRLTIDWTNVSSADIAHKISQDEADRLAHTILPHYEGLLNNDPLYAIGLDLKKIRDQLQVKTVDEWVKDNQDTVSEKIAALGGELAAKVISLTPPSSTPSGSVNPIENIQKKYTDQIKKLESPDELKKELRALLDGSNPYDTHGSLDSISKIVRVLKHDTAAASLTNHLRVLGITDDEFAEAYKKDIKQFVISDQLRDKVKDRLKKIQGLISAHEAGDFKVPSKDDLALIQGVLANAMGSDPSDLNGHVARYLTNLFGQVKDEYLNNLRPFSNQLVNALEMEKNAKAFYEKENAERKDRGEAEIDLKTVFAPQAEREFTMFELPGATDETLAKQEAEYIKRRAQLENTFFKKLGAKLTLSDLESAGLSKEKIEALLGMQYEALERIPNAGIEASGTKVGNTLDSGANLSNISDKIKNIYEAAIKCVVGDEYHDAMLKRQPVDADIKKKSVDHAKEYNEIQTDLKVETNSKYCMDPEAVNRFEKRFNRIVPFMTRLSLKIKQVWYKTFMLPGFVSGIVRPFAKYGPYAFVAGAALGIACVLFPPLSILAPAVPFLMSAGALAGICGWAAKPTHNLFAKSAHKYLKNEEKYKTFYLQGIIDVLDETTQKTQDLIVGHEAFMSIMLKEYYPHTPQKAADAFFYYKMCQREHGFTSVVGKESQSFTIKSGFRENYEKVQDWMARGWGNIAAGDDVDAVKAIIMERGIPMGQSNGQPTNLIRGDKAWKEFQKRYGAHGDLAHEIRILEPFPMSSDFNDPFRKTLFSLSRSIFKRDMFDSPSNENLADTLLSSLGKNSTFFFARMLDTNVKTVSEQIEKSLSQGKEYMKRSLQLPKDTGYGGKSKGGIQLLLARRHAITGLLAETYEEGKKAA